MAFGRGLATAMGGSRRRPGGLHDGVREAISTASGGSTTADGRVLPDLRGVCRVYVGCI
jgi:hypothetical protein